MDPLLLASQLRKPSGAVGSTVAEQLNVNNKYLYELALNALCLNPSDILLEIGMGNGKHINQLFQKFDIQSYTGCDFSQTMVDDAQLCCANSIWNSKIHFVCDAIEHLPLLPMSFSKILAVNVVYFWDNPLLVFEKLFESLNINGTFVLGFRPRNTLELYPFANHGFLLYEPAEIMELLAIAGFQNVKMKSVIENPRLIDGVFYPVHSVVVSAVK